MSLELSTPARFDGELDVIFVCQDGYTLAPARVRAYHFGEVLERRGLRVGVLSFRDTLGAADHGGPVHSMPDADKWELNAKALRILHRHPRALLITQKVGYHFPAVLSAVAKNKNPLILDYDDLDTQCNGYRYLSKLLPGVNGMHTFVETARHATHCVASSAVLARLIAQVNKNVTVIETGVDAGVFHPKVPPSIPRTNDKVRLIWGGDLWGAGMLVSVTEMLKALMHMPPAARDKAEIHFYAFGLMADDLQRLIDRHYKKYLDVHLHGRVEPREMPGILASMDIGLVALNHRSDFDSAKSPTKVFEYMAMGLPFVGTRVGEFDRLMEDGVDCLLAKDTPEMSAKLSLLVQNAPMRRALASASYRKVTRQYTLDTLGEQLYRVVQDARGVAAPA